MENINWNDLLDRYVQGKLNEEERIRLIAKMAGDEVFKRQAEEHQNLYNAMKLYGKRETVKKTLTSFEKDLLPLPALEHKKPTLIKKYWPMVAVAASVAFVSIVGPMLMTQSIQTQQTAIYKELRRNVAQVEQIKKSQSILLADIAKTQNIPAQPGRYAGTGFLISSNGYLVTSYHVVNGADSLFIENEAYGRLKASLVMSDAPNDVAILRIESQDFKSKVPYTISPVEANLGEDVFTLGFPREDIVFGEGSISALSGYLQNPNAYQVSVPVNPGNSGGPLFNGKGDLVGIISGIQTETSSAAFAIKSSILLSVIESSPADTVHLPLVLPKQNTIKNLSKVDQIKKWRDNVFVVRVFNNK
jgi:serine protease Do